MNSNEYYLSSEQKEFLCQMLSKDIILIPNNKSLPSLQIKILEIVNFVSTQLKSYHIQLNSVVIVGSLATSIISYKLTQQQLHNAGISKDKKNSGICCFGRNQSFSTNECTLEKSVEKINDVDIQFNIILSSVEYLDKIREIIVEYIYNSLKKVMNSNELVNSFSLATCYLSKMSKIYDNSGIWSLFGLGFNQNQLSIDIKFSHFVQRPFIFSIDSFAIKLDNIINENISFDDVKALETINIPFSSYFMDTKIALLHLIYKVISIKNIEEVRGGGLFRYVKLLNDGYCHEWNEIQQTVDESEVDSFLKTTFFDQIAKKHSNSNVDSKTSVFNSNVVPLRKKMCKVFFTHFHPNMFESKLRQFLIQSFKNQPLNQRISFLCTLKNIILTSTTDFLNYSSIQIIVNVIDHYIWINLNSNSIDTTEQSSSNLSHNVSLRYDASSQLSYAENLSHNSNNSQITSISDNNLNYRMRNCRMASHKNNYLNVNDSYSRLNYGNKESTESFINVKVTNDDHSGSINDKNGYNTDDDSRLNS